MSKKEPIEHSLIPLSDIDDDARKIAVAWVTDFEPAMGTIQIMQKHKLASDIMNYASNRILVRTKQFQDEITKLLDERELQKQRVSEFKKWLQEITDKETGPSSKQTLQIVLEKFKGLVV